MSAILRPVPQAEVPTLPVPAKPPASNRAISIVAICAVLIFLSLAIGTALTSRPITDEGIFADPAYTLATKGYMGSPALRDKPHLLHIEQHTYWIFPFGPVLFAAWFKMFGAGIFSMRALSICFGLLGLVAIFVLIKNLSNNLKIALLAFLLTALDYLYIYGSSSGRVDVICAALGYMGLACYAALRERNFAEAVLISQTLIVLSGVTHPNGFLYFIGLVFLSLYFDRRKIRWPHILLAAVPYIIGASLWGAYILRDPQAFVAQIRSNAHDAGRLQGLSHPLMGFVREITVRYASAYGFGAHSFGHAGPIYLKALAIFAYLAALVGVLAVTALRRRTEARVVLSIFSLWFVYFAIFDGQKAYYYLVHFVPLYATLLAVFVYWLLSSRKVHYVSAALPLALIVGVQLAGLAYRIRLNSYKNVYQPAVEYLQRNASGSQLIDANIAFVFGLGFPNNLVDNAQLTRLADVFVIDQEIAERLRNSRLGDPATFQHVTNTLANCYEKRYDRNSVQIFVLRPSTCGPVNSGAQ